MAEPLVVVSKIDKSIKRQRLVADISFELGAGQIVGLCGGNGAGKSTVLRMVAGILQPTSGDIRVNGLEWKKERKRFSEQIGYMPDDFQFPQGMTAAEMLSFWAGLRKLPAASVQEALALVGLEDKRHKAVGTFSKGMRQRVLFAQAILAKPALLIMDEPTNGMDPYWIGEFMELLKQMKRQGQTVLFSTHQLEVAEELADYVLFLNSGRVCGEGPVELFRKMYGTLPLHAAFRHSLGLDPGGTIRDDE